jgi:hypothetical protein
MFDPETWRKQAPVWGTRVSWREGGRVWQGEIFPRTKDYPPALVADGLNLRPLFLFDEEAADLLESAKFAGSKRERDLLWDADRRDQRLAERLARVEQDIHIMALRGALAELDAIGLPCRLCLVDEDGEPKA